MSAKVPELSKAAGMAGKHVRLFLQGFYCYSWIADLSGTRYTGISRWLLLLECHILNLY